MAEGKFPLTHGLRGVKQRGMDILGFNARGASAGGRPPREGLGALDDEVRAEACGSLQVPSAPSIEVHDDLGTIPKPNVTDDHEADREPLPT